MQLETALRLPALAMQLSKLMKTLVLRVTKVPKRTANTMAMISAATPHTSPAMACPELGRPNLAASRRAAHAAARGSG